MVTTRLFLAVIFNNMGKILITIGRQYGSGGRRVAEALGEKLGIPVYNNELITEAAKKSGFSPSLFEKKDEKKKFFDFFSDSFNFDNELFRIQSEVIRDIASQGSAIFVGRASDYVLRDMECIDVFLSCPLEIRKKMIARRNSVDLERAEVLCRKQDKTRAAYYNYFTFCDWGVASNYDLCLDTSILGIDGTADFIIDFGRRRGYIE